MTSATAIEKPDLFERIAQALPLEQREEYWHEMAYLKHLHSEDELLRLTPCHWLFNADQPERAAVDCRRAGTL